MNLEFSYSQTTNDIYISAVPKFLEKESVPHQSQYVFSYAITIRNESTQPVQLIDRHWIIESGGKVLAEVTGPGVVGLQPLILPQHEHKYESGVVIHHLEGAMEGTYRFKKEDGSFVSAVIPKFDLIYPGIIQ